MANKAKEQVSGMDEQASAKEGMECACGQDAAEQGSGVVVKKLELNGLDQVEVMRHTTAHVLAQALKRIYGSTAVRLGTGPATEQGFFYDVELDVPVSIEHLAAIEQEMARIVAENLPVVRERVSREEALRLFAERGESYKLEIIHGLPLDAELSLYRQGEFVDLCRGPHLESTGRIGAFKLLRVAGAYWKGDAGNPMLQRIYGTAFTDEEQLNGYLRAVEEAKKRDHRKLGRELGLFMFSEEAPGMPFYQPKGMLIRTELEHFSRMVQRSYGYDEVRTPFMMNKRLWEQSGHWDHYKDNMYFAAVDEEEFALKPMNCPGHMLMFKEGLRSYRELPIRIMEFGQVHRHEASGALNGMMRVRTFCQDDAHIFALPEQIEAELMRVLELIDEIYHVFGFAYSLELSTRPENSMGSEELWEEAERALRHVLDARGAAYRVNEGDGAFYGPKIDFHIQDALGRSWQCGTVQLDFQMPEKFDLAYVGEDGGKHRPVVIHRAIFGSIDRFIGILTEHYAGSFPVWLAPVQVKLLPVSAAELPYAEQVRALLLKAGVRAELDSRQEKLGYRIREAQLMKVPYMLVLGERERVAGTAAARKRDGSELPQMSIAELGEWILREAAARE